MAYLFFDSDSAGQAAATRSVDSLYDAGLEVMVMVPPPGEDPDSMAIKSGREGIEAIKSGAQRYLDYRVGKMDIKKSGIIVKEKLIKELAELAGRIGDDTRRQLFIDEAAHLLQVPANLFLNLLPKETFARKSALAAHTPRKIADIEQELLSLILSHPDQIDMVREKVILEDFQDPKMAKIFSLLLTVYKIHGAVSESMLLDLVDDKSLIAAISSLNQISLRQPNIPKKIKDYIAKMLEYKREKIIDQLREELALADAKKDAIKSRQLAQEITELMKKR
jgi:DNA primase